MKRLLIIGMTSMVLAGSAMLLSCSEQGSAFEPVPTVPTAPSSEPGPVRLAFASALSSHAGTRLTSDIVQNTAPYRTIEDFRFFGIKKEGSTITSVSRSIVSNQDLKDHTDLGVRYYHYNHCDMTRGVNGCLVYAKAKDVAKATPEATMAYNGSLSPQMEDAVASTDDIYFEPVSIYDDEETIPTEAENLANALTEIANVSANNTSWATVNNPDLRSLFSHFTNYGYDLPGSTASVKAWILALRNAVEPLPFGAGTIDRRIRDEIISKIDLFLSEDNDILKNNYPQDINLPDGAAALRWTDVVVNEVTVKKFEPQLRTTTLDDINSVSRFVYPPALYYRVESGIWTSKEEVTFDQYKDKTKWKRASENDDEAVQSLFPDGGTITTDTKTVAIQDPLQYAVAQLQLKVKVDDDNDNSQLKYDAQDHTIAYTDGTNHYFRLTGVIVGGQRKVGYDFKPVTPSDVDVRFVYDSQVPSNFWLKKNSTDEVNTLVLQSYDHEDLNVILEFEYTGTTEFKCLNGYVYPHTRFYLVGELKADDFTSGDDDNNKDRIFTQDYTTSIQMTVKSLEKAYNVLPSILAKNLEIGVMTTPMWKAAQPSDPVIME